MNELLGNASSYEKILWGLTIPFTVLFAVQLFLNFFGIGGGDRDSDLNTDSGHDFSDAGDHSYPIFTFRNFVIFFTVLGWSGITCVKLGLPIWAGLAISSILSIIVLGIVISIFVMMNKLAESGNFKIKNCVGLDGQVYLEIPASRNGTGKIQINVQGSFREIEAVTDEKELIKTGTLVSVYQIAGNNIVVVKKK
ncbi:hypothetical protein KA977_05010 [Candidatus Dependentiae bacterium]|nr:hypothetical protein [Candidatus Dependentiae bacterium]